MSGSGYTFILAKWQRDARDICSVREQVLRELAASDFPPIDASTDECAYHVLVYDAAERAVGVARMQADGRIDYVAVLRPWRGTTVGAALLTYLVHIAQARRLMSVWTYAPEQVRRFFERNGFEPESGSPDLLNRYVRTVRREAPKTVAVH